MLPCRLLYPLLALALTACVVGDADLEESVLEAPTFEPEPAAPPAPDRDPDDVPEPAETEPEPTGTEPAAPPPDEDRSRPTSADDEPPESTRSTDEESATEVDEDGESAPVRRSRVTDPRGDTQSARLTSGPRYADLVGGLLERHPTRGYRLAIELDGGAPEHARDGDHTMNVATFYDLTGDGHVDVEVWANLADGGWDTAFFDNRAGEAVYSDDDEITVRVDDGRLVLDFPLPVLDGAERFRWAVASEWGRYEQLGTPLSVRDEMPDDGEPASFPD